MNVLEKLARLNKLFVYGIFLSDTTRDAWRMGDAEYATVRGYATITKYGNIVEAIEVDDQRVSLSGLLVDIPHDFNWEDLDSLEAGYKRKKVKTTMGDTAYMYVKEEK